MKKYEKITIGGGPLMANLFDVRFICKNILCEGGKRIGDVKFMTKVEWGLTAMSNINPLTYPESEICP